MVNLWRCGEPLKKEERKEKRTQLDAARFCGLTRSWTNGGGYAEGGNLGNGWVITQLPSLQQPDSNLMILVKNGVQAIHFDLAGGTWGPRFFEKSTLASAGGEIVLTDTTGAVTRYYDFSTSYPTAQRGAFKSYTDRAGNSISVASVYGDGKVKEIQRGETVGSDTITEALTYTYITSGANAGLLSNVMLRRKVNSGSWNTVRQAEYAYYTDGDASGGTGDLKLVFDSCAFILGPDMAKSQGFLRYSATRAENVVPHITVLLPDFYL